MLEYADVAGAETLRAYCLAVAVCNLDAVLLEAGGAFEEVAPHLLAELERLYRLRLAGAGSTLTTASSGISGSGRALSPQASEPAGPSPDGDKPASVLRVGSRLQPGRRPTAAAPCQGDLGRELEEEGLALGIAPLPAGVLGSGDGGASSFRDRLQADAEAAAARLQRTLAKKLQQIEHLADKAAAGGALDAQQRCKLEQRPVILSALAALEGGMAVEDVQSILRAASAGREHELELVGAGTSSGTVCAALPAGSASKQQPKAAAARSKRSAQKGPTSVESAAAAAGASGSGRQLGGPAEDIAGAGADSSAALLGSSPPASSLVPAFGYEGSAAAAAGSAGAPAAAGQPGTPAAASEQASPHAGQMRSLVGFAASDAPDATQQQQQQPQQPPLLVRTSGGAGGSRPKSAAKRKGEQASWGRWDGERASWRKDHRLQSCCFPVVPPALPSSATPAEHRSAIAPASA